MNLANLAQVSTENPDWLDRLLVYEKECDLGVAFYAHADHHGMPDEAWDQPMPGGLRPTLREAWTADQLALDAFLEPLRRGEVAIAPPSRDATFRAIRVVLGDYLGRGGVRQVQGASEAHGIRIEVFSPSLLPTFTPVIGVDNWTLPANFVSPAAFYASEWARSPAADEAARLDANGHDPPPAWWADVALATSWADVSLPAAARLPADGVVWHYRLFDVARWVNDVTWKHERHKYRDPVAAASPRPRSRRQ